MKAANDLLSTFSYRGVHHATFLIACPIIIKTISFGVGFSSMTNLEVFRISTLFAGISMIPWIK